MPEVSKSCVGLTITQTACVCGNILGMDVRGIKATGVYGRFPPSLSPVGGAGERLLGSGTGVTGAAGTRNSPGRGRPNPSVRTCPPHTRDAESGKTDHPKIPRGIASPSEEEQGQRRAICNPPRPRHRAGEPQDLFLSSRGQSSWRPTGGSRFGHGAVFPCNQDQSRWPCPKRQIRREEKI